MGCLRVLALALGFVFVGGRARLVERPLVARPGDGGVDARIMKLSSDLEARPAPRWPRASHSYEPWAVPARCRRQAVRQCGSIMRWSCSAAVGAGGAGWCWPRLTPSPLRLQLVWAVGNNGTVSPAAAPFASPHSLDYDAVGCGPPSAMLNHSTASHGTPPATHLALNAGRHSVLSCGRVTLAPRGSALRVIFER
jgi:hypothetical protein